MDRLILDKLDPDLQWGPVHSAGRKVKAMHGRGGFSRVSAQAVLMHNAARTVVKAQLGPDAQLLVKDRIQGTDL